MARITLSRRTFLRGASGAAVGLPFLEIMGEGTARAAVAPRRYLVCYAGTSLGRDGSTGPQFWTPKNAGPNYDLARGLSPLGKADVFNGTRTIKAYDVQDEVSVVSGLKIPYPMTQLSGNRNTPSPTPEGRVSGFHGNTMAPLLSGNGNATSDQIVSDAIGKGTRFEKGLQYQIQPTSYNSANQRGEICWRSSSTGTRARVSLTASPQAAFKSLFTNFTAPTPSGVQDQASIARKQAEQVLVDRDKSVLDLVLRRADRLKTSLGNRDRVRLEQHFDEIRDLEKRIATIPEVRGGASCKMLADPGADPSSVQLGVAGDGKVGILGWSDEDKRAEVMRDLLYMAFTCDLARAAVLLITYGQSYMNVERLNGLRMALHNSNHAGATDKHEGVMSWHVEQFAWLTRKLKDTTDIDGSRMIDNTVMLMVTEGGFGYDPEGGINRANHSTDNMAVLVAGGRALGLRPGRHIPKDNAANPASVLVSAMKAVGVNQPLGVVSAGIPELL